MNLGNVSQLGGMFDWVGDLFGDIIGGIQNLVAVLSIEGLKAILWDGLIGSFFTYFVYMIQAGFFILMDCIQGIFRKVAGLDVYYIQGNNTAQSGDIVYSLLTNDTIISVFIAVLGVSIVMLFMATIIAIIKSEWTVQGANPKGKIWGQALKSLFYFIMVPVVCILGVWMSNVILKSLDAATGGGGDTRLSGQVFAAAAYSSNRARNNSDFASELNNTSTLGGVFRPQVTGVYTMSVGDMVDKAFKENVSLPAGKQTLNLPYVVSGSVKHSWMVFTNNQIRITQFSVTDPMQVWVFYDLITYNYFIGFVGGFIAISILLVTCIGVIQRFFEVCILFVASPPLIALMPIDNGKKYEKWRGEFIKRVISAYGPILALNLFFIILPLLLRINLWPSGGLNDMFNAIVHMLFMIVGLVSVKEFSGVISNLIDAQDALKVGEDHKKQVTQMAGRAGVAAIAGAKLGNQLRKDWKEGRKEKKAADSKMKGIEMTNAEYGNEGKRKGWVGRRLGHAKVRAKYAMGWNAGAQGGEDARNAFDDKHSDWKDAQGTGIKGRAAAWAKRGAYKAGKFGASQKGKLSGAATSGGMGGVAEGMGNRHSEGRRSMGRIFKVLGGSGALEGLDKAGANIFGEAGQKRKEKQQWEDHVRNITSTEAMKQATKRGEGLGALAGKTQAEIDAQGGAAAFLNKGSGESKSTENTTQDEFTTMTSKLSDIASSMSTMGDSLNKLPDSVASSVASAITNAMKNAGNNGSNNNKPTPSGG